MIWLLIIALAFIAFVCFAIYYSDYHCPREEAGYRCKGRNCEPTCDIRQSFERRGRGPTPRY